MKIKLIFSLALASILSVSSIIAQETKDTTTKVGGTFKPYTSNEEPIVLENAQLSVIYEFKHEVFNNKDVSFFVDTMQLVSGSQYSIYFDRNNSSRRKAFSDYFRKDDPPKVWIPESYPDFLEMATRDDNVFIPQKVGDTYELYKDRNKNYITVMDYDDSEFSDELFFYYEEQMSPIAWEVHEDTTSVLGYICNKATCDFEGRSYTAWFTLDIPINDGPYKFYGLPGMIMKVEDSEDIFHFTAIGLEKLDDTEIIIQSKDEFEKMTKSEYFKIKIRMQQNNTVFYRSGALLHFSNKKDGIVYTPIEITKN